MKIWNALSVEKNLMQMTVVFLATEILSVQIVLKKKKIMMIHQKTKTNKK